MSEVRSDWERPGYGGVDRHRAGLLAYLLLEFWPDCVQPGGCDPRADTAAGHERGLLRFRSKPWWQSFPAGIRCFGVSKRKGRASRATAATGSTICDGKLWNASPILTACEAAADILHGADLRTF